MLSKLPLFGLPASLFDKGVKDKSFRVIIDCNSKNDPGGLFKFEKVGSGNDFVCLQLFIIASPDYVFGPHIRTGKL